MSISYQPYHIIRESVSEAMAVMSTQTCSVDSRHVVVAYTGDQKTYKTYKDNIHTLAYETFDDDMYVCVNVAAIAWV